LFHPRVKVLSELGNKVLPKTRGKKTILTRDELETLRFVYDEMKLCIKEIKQKLDLPLKKPSSEDDYDRYQYNEEDLKFIEEDTGMKITQVFNNQEISLVLANKRISDISADIIVARLHMCRHSNITSARTLQDILHKFTPTFA